MLRKEYKFIIGLIGVVFVFFSSFIFLGKIPFPGDLLVSGYNPWRTYSFLGFGPGGMPNKAQYFDVLRQLYPWKILTIESLRHFTVPLWNPYNFSGSPLLANNQSAVWYPLNLLYFLLPMTLAWGLLVMLQPLLGSIGTYFFTRKIGVGKWGSLLSAVAYGYCLFQSVFIEYNTIGHVIALLPWTLLGLELLLSNRKIAGYFLFVGSLVFSFFAGHIQIWGFSVIFILAYVLFRFLVVKKKILFGLEVGILFLIGVALTGIQSIPTFELIGHAARVSQNYPFLIKNLLIQPYQTLLLLIPDLFGNPATRNYLFSDSYPGNAMYIGMLPFLFALFAITKIRVHRQIRFFTSTAIVLLLFLVRTPFTELFYKLQIPFFSTGSPSNALFLLSFSLAVLTGFGLDYYIQEKNKKVLRIAIALLVVIGLILLLSRIFHLQISYKNTVFSLLLAGVSGFVVVFGYLFPKKKTIITCVIIVITIADLFYFFQKFNPFVKPVLVYPPVGITTTLQQLTQNQRVWSYGDATVDPNVLSVYHIQDPTGYDPLYPKVYGEFISSSQDGNIRTTFTNQSRSDAVIAPAFHEEDLTRNPYRFKILDATSVGYILSKEILSTDFLTQRHWKLTTSQDGWNIYQNISALPHAYIVGSYNTYTDANDFSKKFYANTFDVHSLVLLEKPVGNIMLTQADVRIIRYSPEQVAIKTITNGTGLLVLTDTYFPGWNASIDGKQVPILKANYTFKAVKIPAGVHTVTFSYQPSSFSTGLTLTIMGVVGFFIMLFIVKRRNYRYE